MKTDPAHAAAIEESLEIAAERVGDLTLPVHEKLFAQQPEMRALFWRDTNHAIKGEMLARVMMAILDFVGERAYAHRLIQCEVITHEGYDVPRDVFATFFGVVAETVQEACGARWTEAMAIAWRKTLRDLDFYVTHPDQAPPEEEEKLRAEVR
jgi:hemoglobin-like flavoprotein